MVNLSNQDTLRTASLDNGGKENTFWCCALHYATFYTISILSAILHFNLFVNNIIYNNILCNKQYSNSRFTLLVCYTIYYI